MVEVLRLVPGLHVDQRGGRGGIGSVYLRGADPNFVVVMIDGISVNDPTNSRGGSFNLAALDVANIERIEILRGSASAVYGSDAMAGCHQYHHPVGDTRVAGTPQRERWRDRYRDRQRICQWPPE